MCIRDSVDGVGQWQLSSATAAVINGSGNWTRFGPNDPAAGSVMAFTSTAPYHYEDGNGRSFQITRFEATGANTELVYTNTTGVQTVFTWNGSRFVAGSLEWQPPPGFALQGFSQPYTWNSTGTAHNFSYVKTTSAGNEPRAILFTEWSHGSDVIKFTETRAGTTPVFEYHKSLNQFIGTAETWTPPANFHVVGNFPSTASPASSSQAYVVEVAPGEYNQSGLTSIVGSALNNKASTILPKAVTYSATLSGHQMSIGLLYNGAARRYNYEGLYTLAGAPRSVVRDWRHVRDSTSYSEYVMSPQYDFDGIGYTLSAEELVDSYTGQVGPGTANFPVGVISFTNTAGNPETFELKMHNNVNHYGGHPAPVSYTHLTLPTKRIV